MGSTVAAKGGTPSRSLLAHYRFLRGCLRKLSWDIINKSGKVVARFTRWEMSVVNPDPVEDREERLTLGKVAKPRFFYGYVVATAGFIIWLIGWGATPPPLVYSSSRCWLSLAGPGQI